MSDLTQKLATRIHEKGGKLFYVGGYVRDKLLGLNPKDIDLVLFTGGEDVNPHYYNEQIGKYTHINSNRDKEEEFQMSQSNKRNLSSYSVKRIR